MKKTECGYAMIEDITSGRVTAPLEVNAITNVKGFNLLGVDLDSVEGIGWTLKEGHLESLTVHFVAQKVEPKQEPEVSLTPTFWDHVEAARWGDLLSYKEGERILAQRISRGSDTDLFVRQFRRASSDLRTAIEQWEDKTGKSCGGSDDSFSDLVSHIIGLGREEYRKVMDNPQAAYDRARAPYASKEGYKESFAYCLHSLT